ncbi:MAG TPA: LuxR C-terminal-related transcriptional regulator [Solirubrobacteraceae bacterium]|jgi:DNA-binding NarL/FixJ family response regulator
MFDFRVRALDAPALPSDVEAALSAAGWDPDETTPAEQEIGLLAWQRATRREVSEIEEHRAAHPGPMVAILSELPSVRGARAVAARLEGSVLQSDLEHALVPTLLAVAAGCCVVPRTVRQLVDRPPLSPRERQILAMVVLDYSNGEIARKLFVTESAVKNHLSSAFAKLGVTSRNAAAELILDGESGLGPGILRISPEEEISDDDSR